MILIDTNVISSPGSRFRMRASSTGSMPRPSKPCSSAITVAELRFGIAAMPEGKRRTVLHDRLEDGGIAAFLRP